MSNIELVNKVSQVKIHIPPLSPDHTIGELRNILLAGVADNARTVLCNNIDAADYVFLCFRHFNSGDLAVTHPEKTILVDYRDDPQAIFAEPALLYFKRSNVHPKSGQFIQYDRAVEPISYCVKDAYYRLLDSPDSNRDIDIAVFFNAEENPDNARDYYRCSLANFIKAHFSHRNIFVGISGNAGKVGRNEFQPSYFDIMTRSKLVVTCNPDRCEGDYRLFEALSSRSLVLCNQMITPVVNPLVDRQHLVFYDKHDLGSLVPIIEQLLTNENERATIAAQGYEFAMQLHCARNRIDEIIDRAAVATELSSALPNVSNT